MVMSRGRRAGVGDVLVVALLIPVWVGWAGLPGEASAKAGPTGDAAVATRDWGSAVGRVYDANTGIPIEGVRVVVEEKGLFANEGRSVGTTDKVGRYECKAPLGRISTKFSAAGVLGSALGLGGLLGPVSTTTRRIDATQLNLRITKPGYQAFEGVVRCRYGNAEGFFVSMEPVLLTPADSPEVSTTADGWGALKILEVQVEPAIAHPREKVKVIARVQAPAAAAAKEKASFLEELFGGGSRSQLRLVMYSPLWRSDKSLGLAREEEGVLRFEGEIGLPKSVATPSIYISVMVERSPVEIVAGGGMKQALLQVIAKEADSKAAELRLAASKLTEEGDSAQAAERLKELSGLPEATLDDLVWLASVSEEVHDYGGSVGALRQALRAIRPEARSVALLGREMKPEEARWQVLSRYAMAMLRNEQAEAVIAEVGPEVEKIAEKDRPRRVPGAVMVAMGSAYLDNGKVPEAQAIRDKLNQWPGERIPAEARIFRQRLRLAMCEKAVADNPNNAQAWAEWGRALIDQGQWEEASLKLQTALQRDPNMPAVQRDLAYTLLHLRGQQETVEKQLDEAIAGAQKQAAGGEGARESKNFYDWHTLGMLLYRKACQQRLAGDPGEAQSLAASEQALVEAVKCGRAGAEVEEQSTFTVQASYSTREVKIAGFAYPEAACDYLILDSLEALAQSRGDYLAWFTLATALLNLGQPELAEPALRECATLRPEFAEASYAQAMLALQQDKPAEAAELLRQVLSANPRHPFANKRLAEVYAEEGDMVGAAGCLAAHAATYGGAK